MLLNGYDLGKCGIEQVLCAGKVSFDTKDVNKGVVLIELPKNIIITKAVAVVNTAFNAATTNVLLSEQMILWMICLVLMM